MRTPIDLLGAQREQWDDGNNFLAIAPGVIFGYERNTTTNTFLRRNGIEIVTIAGEDSAAAAAVHAACPAPSSATPSTQPSPGPRSTALNLHGFLKGSTSDRRAAVPARPLDLKRAKATGTSGSGCAAGTSR